MSGYYFWPRSSVCTREKRDNELSEKIIEMHQMTKNRYVSPRIHKTLKKQN
jgi:hypothetical protein